MPKAYLSLGSNVGDRIGFIQKATMFLCEDEKVKILSSSAIYETEPWGGKTDKWFINAAVEIETTLSPRGLLDFIQNIEKLTGRNREEEKRWAERVIDIDILLYDEEEINEPDLIIPHKHMHQRAFVLVPLLELIPGFIHKKFGSSILELHEKLNEPENVFLYGTV